MKDIYKVDSLSQSAELEELISHKEKFNGLVTFHNDNFEKNEDASNLLVNILKKALNLNPDKSIIIDNGKYPNLRLRNICNLIAVKNVVIFGVSPKQIGVNLDFVVFKPLSANGINILMAPFTRKTEPR